MASVKIENVNKGFDEGKSVMEQLNLDIADGEFVVLLGPTGSGKSTILRMIAGLDDVSSGSLFINDNLVNQLQPKDRNVAMIFQNHQLIPHLSVYDNIAFGMKLRKFSSDQINTRVKEMARIMGLSDYLQRKPKLLTALERQRVSLARAIVREPDVYLFDDPLQGLDNNLTRNVRSDLVKLQYRVKGTFILATRDQIDAMTLATKIAVMNSGKIEQYDTPRNIYEHPKTMFVASYVGSPTINSCPAELEADDGQIKVNLGAVKVNLGEEAVAKIVDKEAYLNGSKHLTVAIRPEYVSINEASELKATVDAVDNYGTHKVVTLKMPNKAFSEWSLFAASDSEITIGSQVGIDFDDKKLFLFDRETENSVFAD